MADLKKLLAELEDAIPEIRDELGLADGDEGGMPPMDDMPPIPEEGSPEEEGMESPEEEQGEIDAGEGDEMDLMMPPKPKKKSKMPLPF